MTPTDSPGSDSSITEEQMKRNRIAYEQRLIITQPTAPTERHPCSSPLAMRRNEARKLWRKLQDQGWKQVAPQWGAGVDV